MEDIIRERIRGCAVGAAIGDALGMPLEFGPVQPPAALVREMRPGRLPAGSFTDDTEMALALAESLLAHCPLDPADLAQRFVAWFRAGPPDIGRHTRLVLKRIYRGEPWEQAAAAVQAENSWSAANGSVMRCWPVTLAYWDNLDRVLAESGLQSQVTHQHEECVAGSAFVNAAIFFLLHGAAPSQAVAQALDAAQAPQGLRQIIEQAPAQSRAGLPNTGWVRHTLANAVWGLLTTASCEEAVVQVANLGDDADTAASVAGALAGAAYGLAAIPPRWRTALQGEWPLRSGNRWTVENFIELADRLADQ